LTPNFDKVLSNFAFNFNLRRGMKEPQIMDHTPGGVADYQSGLLGRAWHILLASS
jgi:hypothetical protein